MIPLYKAISLLMRVFSRPLINYTKKYHAVKSSNSNSWMALNIRKIYTRMGNYFNLIETKINRKYLKTTTNFAYKPLNEELAIEKGI